MNFSQEMASDTLSERLTVGGKRQWAAKMKVNCGLRQKRKRALSSPAHGITYSDMVRSIRPFEIRTIHCCRLHHVENGFAYSQEFLGD